MLHKKTLKVGKKTTRKIHKNLFYNTIYWIWVVNCRPSDRRSFEMGLVGFDGGLEASLTGFSSVFEEKSGLETNNTVNSPNLILFGIQNWRREWKEASDKENFEFFKNFKFPGGIRSWFPHPQTYGRFNYSTIPSPHSHKITINLKCSRNVQRNP